VAFLTESWPHTLIVPNTDSCWFPARRYGWGWGLPTRWQGSVALLLWASVLFAGLILLRQNPYQPASNIAFVVLMAAVLTLLCYWKGEPTKWRCGDRSG
jgi:hypothetical protein